MSHTKLKVIISPDAERDLLRIRRYITAVLRSPGAAANTIRAINREINSLTDFPSRIALLPDEPARSNGIRRFPVKNYLVYFKIHEKTNAIFILSIVSALQDQDKVISELIH